MVPDQFPHSFIHKTTFLPAVFQHLLSWIKQNKYFLNFFFLSGRLDILVIFFQVEDKKKHEIS